MTNNIEEKSQSTFWRCKGRKGSRHPVALVRTSKCPQCGKVDPRTRNAPSVSASSGHLLEEKPKKDILLLSALAILNAGSGFTTIFGARQILPQVVAYSSGAAIQVLLFLLVSGSTLRHAQRLKWFAVGSFSLVSIYTSFFAYYNFLTSEKQFQDDAARASSAHQNLVSEVFIPLQNKADEIERSLVIQDRLIEEELEGNRVSGISGCGDICRTLKVERENLQNQYDQIRPVVSELEPLFKYSLEGKTPEDIFEADIKALTEVPLNCFPQDPSFECIPQSYAGAFNPVDPRYTELRAKYLDEASRISVLAPFLKISDGEPAAIAAAFMALLVDGSIILLGAGIEVRKKPKKMTVQVKGNGSKFLGTLVESINPAKMTIDETLLKSTDNAQEYIRLLQAIRVETQWIYQTSDEDEDEQWRINPNYERRLMMWMTEEQQRLVSERKASTATGGSSVIVLHLPSIES